MKLFLLLATIFLFSCGHNQQKLNIKIAQSDKLKARAIIDSDKDSFEDRYISAQIKKSNDADSIELYCKRVKDHNVIKVILDNCPASMVCDKIDITFGSDSSFLILYGSIGDINSATSKTIPTDQYLTLNKYYFDIGDTIMGQFDYSGLVIVEYNEPPFLELKISGDFTCVTEKENN